MDRSRNISVKIGTLRNSITNVKFSMDENAMTNITAMGSVDKYVPTYPVANIPVSFSGDKIALVGTSWAGCNSGVTLFWSGRFFISISPL
jgi:hypothetical protein